MHLRIVSFSNILFKSLTGKGDLISCGGPNLCGHRPRVVPSSSKPASQRQRFTETLRICGQGNAAMDTKTIAEYWYREALSGKGQ